MSWHVDIPEIAEEVHFGGRRVRCFVGRPRGVDQMLREAVGRNGAGDAVVAGEVRVSYAELDGIVDRVAANLEAAGVSPGDRVALLLSNRPEFIYVLFAAVRIGAIAVPINVREQTPELSYILSHCGAKVLVHDAAIADRLPTPDDLPALAHRFSVGGDTAGSRVFDELLEEPASPAAAHIPGEEDVAVILYTSGTTGRPKGAMLTHFNICHSVMHFETCMALTEADRSVLAVPASHVTGLVANILTMVRVAGCNLILPEFDARKFLEFAAAERMTYSILVPAMYNLCLLQAGLQPAFDLGCLAHRRLRRRAHAGGDHCGSGRQASRPHPDERLRLDRSDVARDAHAHGRDRASARQCRPDGALRRDPHRRREWQGGAARRGG